MTNVDASNRIWDYHAVVSKEIDAIEDENVAAEKELLMEALGVAVEALDERDVLLDNLRALGGCMACRRDCGYSDRAEERFGYECAYWEPAALRKTGHTYR